MLQKPDTTMDDLLAKALNLTVLDEDGWEINEARGAVARGHCAKAKFCSNRPMSRPLLKTILGRVWEIADNKWGVEIKFSNKNSSFLVFTFKSAQDLNIILGKSPWFLNYGTLILERMESLPQDWEKELLRFPISGCVLHLPSRSITQSNLIRLASLAGEVIDVQVADIPRIKVKCPVQIEEDSSSSAMKFPGLGIEVQTASKSISGNLMDVNMGMNLPGSKGKIIDNTEDQINSKIQKMEKGEASQINCKRKA
ncbi:hypothetical protein G4B88_003408 [Cannabis sativa]|uniref:DUF4283 domain-containing protein n=1 Tax=Cannabis sativa TaxID=3483 RepID=A0A7J6H493_CANSA|nr:hypothetical protein G4B88_003408 [Cannabis sativa]